MSLLRLHRVTKRYDTHLILRDVSLRLDAGERVGLIGRNGTGKTTLLRLIDGRDTPTEGTVSLEQGIRLGYFSQFSELDGAASVQQVLEDLFADVRALHSEFTRISTVLTEASDTHDLEHLLERQATLIEAISHRDGWDYQREIDTALTRLGFNQVRRTQPIGELSGGWRNRAALAHILLEQPDVLLLDEPTNYLDVDGLSWLEGWLQRWQGAVLVVSHDRHFLDQVVTRLVEVENYHLQEYAGSYTQYVREKKLRLRTLERQFLHEEELLALEADAIAERQAVARTPHAAVLRTLADIKKSAPPRPVDVIVTTIYQGLHVPDKLLRVEDVSKRYEAQCLFEDLSFTLGRGERLAIVGPNGCGKSTLIKVLRGTTAPDAGRVVWEGGVAHADFNSLLDDLDPDDTVTHAVNVTGLAYHAPRKQVHRFLSLLQLSEKEQTQRLGTLSGGQRARVALAQCLLSGAPVLLLDEPTNHLDVASAQVMEQALLHFPGAIIVVSHDRFFLDKVATQLLVFGEHTRPQAFTGNWTLWQAAGTSGG